MRLRVRQALERVLGVRIHDELPLGVDIHYDMRRLPFWSPSGVLLDIGANVGQTAARLAKLYPEARILCFEPGPEAWRQLAERTRHLPNVSRFEVALGAVPGTAELFLHERPSYCTLRKDLRAGEGYAGHGSAQVMVRTLDDVLAEQQIGFVQYAKIDTEGFDLEVLHGAQQSLQEHRIALVELEAGFLQDEGKFIPLERFRAHLREFGYLLFGIFEQMRPSDGFALRRCNAVFISERLASIPGPIA